MEHYIHTHALAFVLSWLKDASKSTVAFVSPAFQPGCYFHSFGHDNILLTCTIAHIAETVTPLITVLKREPLVPVTALTLSFQQQNTFSSAVIVCLCVFYMASLLGSVSHCSQRAVATEIS